MSTYSDASLILPVAPYIKDGKIYSLKPTDGTGDFDFSRATEATRVNSDGLIETVGSNVPRLNYPMIDGVVSGCPSLLLEPQRSNLIDYSNKFDTYWSLLGLGTGSAPVLNNNSIISPDGTQNATEVILNVGSGTTTSDRSSIEVNQTVSAGSEYTVSFYIKGKNDGDQLMIGAINGGYELITLTTEWKRYTITQTAASSPRAVFIGIRQGVFGTLNNNVEFYLYGAQLEQGSYATSYIPTSGGVVTRVAETCSQTPPSGIIGQTEGTMYVDVDINTLSTDGQVLRLTNGTSDFGRIVIERNPSNQNQIRVTQWGGAILTFSISIGNRYKIAVGYDSSNSNVYVNGSSIGTTFFTNVAELNKVSLGCNEVGGSIFNDTIKESKIYNTRLSNAELAALTS